MHVVGLHHPCGHTGVRRLLSEAYLRAIGILLSENAQRWYSAFRYTDYSISNHKSATVASATATSRYALVTSRRF